jgi:hypothetical protein
MKHWIRKATAGSTIGIALLLLAVACGGKQTVASKSAQAFREAQKDGAPGGGAHGGHGAAAGDHSTATDATEDQATMTGMDHSTMSTGTGAMPGMDHSNMPGMESGRSVAGMDHSKMNPGQPMAGMDHSKMKPGQSMAGMDHSKMQSGQPMTGMDHSKMQPGQSMAGMDHSKMQPGQPMSGMDHSKMQSGQPMPGMDHSKMQSGQPMPGMDHSKMQPGESMAGMDHSKTQTGQPMTGMDHSNMPGMQEGTASRATVNPPTTNAEMQRVRPAATLKGDAFDAPSAVAVAEAMKASQGGGHEGMEMRGITPGQDRENPPTPAPAFRDGPAKPVNAAPAMDHSSHGQAAPVAPSPQSAPAPTVDHSKHGQAAPAVPPNRTETPQAAPAAATVYTCPMHPEVTSDKPGTCPKCGMALVKKK